MLVARYMLAGLKTFQKGVMLGMGVTGEGAV